MTIINRDQLTSFEGKLVAEASDMGLGAGQWPDQIVVRYDGDERSDSGDETYSRGYSFVTGAGNDAELGGYFYASSGGNALVVYND